MDIEELFAQIIFEQELAKEYGLDLSTNNDDKSNNQNLEQTTNTEDIDEEFND